MAIIDRVKIRIPEAKDGVLEELIISATDRILLRIGKDELPQKLETIAVEIVTKMYRRMMYEGISSESADTLNVTFIDDIFAEYDEEFEKWLKRSDEDEGKNKLKVRFI
ncbi:putative head-tail connector [Streptococcus phage P738]|nr:putative head-tail connector [Streptococcus phage P738]